MEKPLTGSSSASIKKEARDADIKVKATARSNNNEPGRSRSHWFRVKVNLVWGGLCRVTSEDPYRQGVLF